MLNAERKGLLCIIHSVSMRFSVCRLGYDIREDGNFERMRMRCSMRVVDVTEGMG